MTLKKNILLISTIFIFIHSLYAQQVYYLKGYVYNSETNEPVPNANIVVTGTNTGTSSDSEGYFELKLTGGEYGLRITSIGFSDKEITLRLPRETAKPLRIDILPKELEIEGVDVFGSRYIPDRDTAIDRVPLSVFPAITRIDAVEIEKQGAVTLIDAVKYVPGGWTESRGRKTKQFFSVRGQKYPYPNYSINGIWQKEFEETGYFISALDIESIEIIRSSSALVKGLSGLTGIIDVKTKKPDRQTFSFIAKYGGLNSYNTNIRYGNKLDKIVFNTSAALFGTDGPPGRKGKESIANFHGNMDWQLSNKFKLMANATYIDGLREFVTIIDPPGASNIANREEKYDPARSMISYVKLNYHGDNGSITELQTNMTYRNANYIRFNIPQEETTSDEEKDWEYGLNILHSHPLSPSNTIRIGGLYNHWEAPNGKRYYTGRACNVHTWSGVIADEQKIGRVLVDAGFRLIGGYIVEWGGFGIEGSSAGFRNVAPIEDEPARLEWQSVLGGTYILSGSSSLHYNFSGGTIAPRKGSLNEEEATPENEGRFQHDLGYRYKSPKSNELSISAFYAKRNNAIDFSGKTLVTEDDMVLELYENMDKQSCGIELATKINAPALNSFIFANATLMTGTKEAGNSMEDDIQLPNVILNTGLMYENSGFDANLFINYTGPYSNNRFVNPSWTAENDDYPLGDFVLVDLTAGYTFSGSFSKKIFAEVKNILNQKYETVACYPDPGRLFNIGIKIHY
jgi:outer membrane cobalamin receptor